MAANKTIFTIFNEPRFYGHTVAHRKAEDWEPEEFLDRMEYILERTIPAPTPEDRIRAIAANLRGPAHTWWSQTTPNICTREEFEEVITNWDTFKSTFIKEYFTMGNKAEANIDFTDFYQTSEESAYNLLQRVNYATQRFTSMLMKEENVIPPILGILPTDNQEERTAMADFATITGQNRQRISNIFFKREREFHRDIMKEYNDCLVLNITINGLREDRLKTVVSSSANRNETIEEASGRLREAEAQLRRPKNNHEKERTHSTNYRNNFPGEPRSSAIHEIQKEEEGKDINNIANKIKKANPTKKGVKPKRYTSARCNFCNIPNHSEEECRARINISASLLDKLEKSNYYYGESKDRHAQEEEKQEDNSHTQAGNA
jgi:hypothetical protein